MVWQPTGEISQAQAAICMVCDTQMIHDLALLYDASGIRELVVDRTHGCLLCLECSKFALLKRSSMKTP